MAASTIQNPTFQLPSVFTRPQTANPTLSFPGVEAAPSFGRLSDTLSFGEEARNMAQALGELSSSNLLNFFGADNLSMGETPAPASPELSFGDLGPGASDITAPSAADYAMPVAETTGPAEQAQQTVSATGEGLLARGSAGEEVKALQQMLLDNGYDLGDSGADGIFGPQTKEALEAFQEDQRTEQIEEQQTETPDDEMKVDGILGPQTRAALARAEEARLKEAEGEQETAASTDDVEDVEPRQDSRSEAVSRVESAIARDPSIAKEEGPAATRDEAPTAGGSTERDKDASDSVEV